MSIRIPNTAPILFGGAPKKKREVCSFKKGLKVQGGELRGVKGQV